MGKITFQVIQSKKIRFIYTILYLYVQIHTILIILEKVHKTKVKVCNNLIQHRTQQNRSTIKNERISYEIQRASVKEIDAGKSLKSIAEAYKINYSTLPSTVSRHKAGKNRISESLNDKWNSNRKSTKSSFSEAEKCCVI